MAVSCAWPAWEIEYSDGLVEAMRRAGAPISKRVGRFATRQDCLAAIDEAVARSGDPTLRMNMYPAPGGYDEPGGSASGGSEGTPEPVWGENGYGIPFYHVIRGIQERAAERRSQRARDLNLKGNEQYGKGNWTAAIQYYQEALKVAPEDPVIRQNLKNAQAKEKAYSLNRKGLDAYQYRNWAESVRHFREALQATPGDPTILKNLKEAQFWLDSEADTRAFLQQAARERKIAEAARETREAEQRRRLAQTDAAFADLQADALGLLGKPEEGMAAGSDDPATIAAAGPTLGQVRVPVPPSFSIRATTAIEGDSSAAMELPPTAYRIIGLIGQGIQNAPRKLGETLITALGGGSQLGVIKVAKGLSDEAGRSMQNAVDLIGRGYPEAETINQIRGSESRAMKIYIDSFSDIPLPPSEQEKQEMERNGRKWFRWATQPMGGSR